MVLRKCSEGATEHGGNPLWAVTNRQGACESHMVHVGIVEAGNSLCLSHGIQDSTYISYTPKERPSDVGKLLPSLLSRLTLAEATVTSWHWLLATPLPLFKRRSWGN